MRIRAAMAVVAGILAAAAGAEDLRPTPVAWFSDNGDRQALQVLRNLPEEALTETEQAILRAANRIGWITLPGCRRASNAILIRVGDRDAVVTSRHLVTGPGPYRMACRADEPAFFQMNASYIVPDSGSKLSPDDLSARIALEPDPLNYGREGVILEPAEDWLVYFLTETISDKPLPDGAYGAGELRGAVAFSTRRPPSGEAVVIGYDGRFDDENGWQMSWQACDFFQNNGNPGTFLRPNPVEDGVIHFSCDAAPGASSSLMATMEDGELTLQGLVTAVLDAITGTDVPVPKAGFLWNMGTGSAAIEAAVDRARLSGP